MLINSDCLDLLGQIPDNSIDMVLTDPPYYQIMKHDWDNQWKTEDHYLDWCNKWTSECERVLKPGGILGVWGTTKTDTFLRYKLQVLNQYKSLLYQNWIVWSYDWGGRTKKTFPRKHEDLLIYTKGKKFTFNADQVRVPYKIKVNYRGEGKNHPLGKLPTDVWELNNLTVSPEFVSWHPTQKPFGLLERLITAYTNPGDRVLDIFSGSGSTMIVCDKLGREFIGSELSKEYYAKSLQRREDWK
jgi:DNA modification methylase